MRRIGVIGDVHARHGRLGEALDWLSGQSLDVLLCTGDLADGDGCVDASVELLVQAGVRCVAGNHDRWLLTDRVRHVGNAHRRVGVTDSTLDYLEGLPKTLELDTSLGPLLLCHGVDEDDLGKVWPGTARSQIERNADIDRLIAQRHYRFMINGHLHYRVLIDFEHLLLMNAGTLNGQRAGVSIMDFEAKTVSAHELDPQGAGTPVRVAEYPIAAHSRQTWKDTQAFDGQWQPVSLYADR